MRAIAIVEVSMARVFSTGSGFLLPQISLSDAMDFFAALVAPILLSAKTGRTHVSFIFQ